jgi:hypothetical protein
VKADKYDRSVALLCPTCGCTDFKGHSTEDESTLICARCGRELSKDDLVRENNENIDTHLREIGKQAIGDVTKELRKSFERALKGSKYIKFKI